MLFFDICKDFVKKMKKWHFFDVEVEREWYKNGIRMVLQWYYNGITLFRVWCGKVRSKKNGKI